MGAVFAMFSGVMLFGIWQLCLLLLNSENALKVMVPRSIRKDTYGWINYSCKVISQKRGFIRGYITISEQKIFLNQGVFLINNIVKETSIGNCGSKSIILESKSIVVKEQRVNGNLQLLNNYIRLNYTLMDLETNYQAIIPSKQINIQTRLLYCHKVVQQSCREKPIHNLSHKMNPWFITGFVDGEGSFWVNISRENTFKIGWRVKLFFQIALHKRDKVLLEQINNFLLWGKYIRIIIMMQQFIIQLPQLEI